MARKHKPIGMKPIAGGLLARYEWVCPHDARSDWYLAVPGIDDAPICWEHGVGVKMLATYRKK